MDAGIDNAKRDELLRLVKALADAGLHMRHHDDRHGERWYAHEAGDCIACVVIVRGRVRVNVNAQGPAREIVARYRSGGFA